MCVCRCNSTDGGVCGGGGHALTILQEVLCVLHGLLHIAQLCMGGRRVTVSVCLSVCPYVFTRSPGTLHMPGGRRSLSGRSHPCSLPRPPSLEPPASTHGHTTTALGCKFHGLGSGMQGEGRGRGRGEQGVVQASALQTLLPTVYTSAVHSGKHLTNRIVYTPPH